MRIDTCAARIVTSELMRAKGGRTRAGYSYGTHLHTILVHGTLEALFLKSVVCSKVMCLIHSDTVD